MIQNIFLLPIRKASVNRIKYAKVSDKVSVADINPPIVTIICESVGSVSTLTAVRMLKLY